MRLALACLALGAAVITACAPAGPKGPPVAVINRALQGAPGEAQPSNIVATELAFARVAREEGQWTAFRRFAAPGAMIHGANGAVPAAGWLAGRADPAEAVQWAPRAIVMSCDGATAVSMGRFRSPEGIVGNFVTMWERQPDLTYRWVYDAGGPDVPQPPPQAKPEEGDIVVTAMDSVKGMVATCPREGDPVLPPPADSPVGKRAQDAKLSGDGTLRWRWEHRGEGEKYVAAEYWYNGRWETAIEERLASPGE